MILERSRTINSICLSNDKNQELLSETMAFIVGWVGKYSVSDLNTLGSFHLKQGLVYIISKDYSKCICGTFDENDEIICAINTRDNADSRSEVAPILILFPLITVSQDDLY